MNDTAVARLEALERRHRRLLLINVLGLCALAVAALLQPGFAVRAQEKVDPKSLTLSELVIVDNDGKARLRLGGSLPDAVQNGKTKPRGQRAAGILLYDATGVERSGYVTLEPSGNVALTLDTRTRQVATFVAGPTGSGTSALQLFSIGSAVELRNDEDGPSIHAVRRKQVVFHEPSVENPEGTAMCKALREAKNQATMPQLLDVCRARTSEAACQVCLVK
jgi:hypothetical protein